MVGERQRSRLSQWRVKARRKRAVVKAGGAGARGMLGCARCGAVAMGNVEGGGGGGQEGEMSQWPPPVLLYIGRVRRRGGRRKLVMQQLAAVHDEAGIRRQVG